MDMLCKTICDLEAIEYKGTVSNVPKEPNVAVGTKWSHQIFTSDDTLCICFDLPGMKLENLNLLYPRGK